MKIILNNVEEEEIRVSHINKDYNFVEDENVSFVLDCTLDSLEYKSDLNYLENYFNNPITAYKVIDEINNDVEEQNNINARLDQLSYNYSDGYFFSRFIIFVYREENQGNQN